MISAWDVYWVMQLDSIIFALGLLSFLSFGAASFGFLTGFAEDNRGYIRTGKLLLVPTLIAGFLAAFTPTSKTAAAMIILPALTSDTVVEAVAPEARELYDLAKDALRSVSTKAATPAAVEPKPEK